MPNLTNTKIDPSILASLSLDPAKTTIATHGGSGFSSTFKVVSKVLERDGDGGKDGREREKMYFVKMGRGEESGVMFRGEHTSLNAIHAIIPSLCPKSYAHGTLSTGTGSFLITDFLTLSPTSLFSNPSSDLKARGSGMSLAKKLARLHGTMAPVPEGYEKPQFGFPVTTCCGSTPQSNTFSPTWSIFFSQNRISPLLNRIASMYGPNPELTSLARRIISTVIPRLLGEGHLKDKKTGGDVPPVVVHGDLWSGNHGRGIIANSNFDEEGGGGVEEVVFDPSSSYSHSEFEFGIMNMFGGFEGGFKEEYFREMGNGGIDEPREEFEDRVELYELYHHLNHYAIFRGGYQGGAVRIMKDLIKKYGGGE